MLTPFRVASVLACLCFINSTAAGQQIAAGQHITTGSAMYGVQYELHDNPHIDSRPGDPVGVPSTAVSQCAVEQGRRCYGQCDNTSYAQPSTCDSCGPDCRGNCKHCRWGHSDRWDKHHEYFRYETNLLCPGDRLYSLLEPQLMNGRLAQLEFYGFHFQWNSNTQTWHLTQSGWYNVQKLARILPSTPGTILVDPTGDPRVDESRAQVVRDAFALNGWSQVPVNVAVGKPRGIGLSGEEAITIYQQRQAGSPFSRGSTSGVRGSTLGTRIGPTPIGGGSR